MVLMTTRALLHASCIYAGLLPRDLDEPFPLSLLWESNSDYSSRAVDRSGSLHRLRSLAACTDPLAARRLAVFVGARAARRVQGGSTLIDIAESWATNPSESHRQIAELTAMGQPESAAQAAAELAGSPVHLRLGRTRFALACERAHRAAGQAAAQAARPTRPLIANREIRYVEETGDMMTARANAALAEKAAQLSDFDQLLTVLS